MQNAHIWKSIEALCDEAESVIKSGEPVIEVIQSIAPPALAHLGISHTDNLNTFSSKPAPPKANIVERSNPKKDVVNATLSPVTMTEIAAAIERASQSAQKLQIMDQPSQAMSDQLRKDLMVEVSLAVRSVLANELPGMVRHAISESLHEFTSSSPKTVGNDSGVLEAKPRPLDKNKKTAPKKRAAPKKASDKKVAVKKTKAKKTK